MGNVVKQGLHSLKVVTQLKLDLREIRCAGDLLGKDAQVRLTMCDEVQRPAHGKFRYVVSHAKPACWTGPAGVSRKGGEVDSRLA